MFTLSPKLMKKGRLFTIASVLAFCSAFSYAQPAPERASTVKVDAPPACEVMGKRKSIKYRLKFWKRYGVEYPGCTSAANEIRGISNRNVRKG